ncbi:MAG: superoxide dismutase family protein [Acidimicrobiia bacterium]
MFQCLAHHLVTLSTEGGITKHKGTDMNKKYLFGIALGLAVAAAAFGGSEAAAPAPAPIVADAPMMDMDMNMGDVLLVAAVDVAGAEVASGQFQRLDTAPFGYDNVDGQAWLARSDAGTTVTIELTGLLPNSPFISHVHAGACGEAGGPHYQFELGGSTQPPNEIHLMFTSDADGIGFMTAENSQVAAPEARSIVVHPMNTMDAKVACAELG